MAHELRPHRLSLGIWIALFAYLFLSVASCFVFSFQGKFPTIQIIFIQNFISFFCILPWGLRNGWGPLKTKELPTHLVRDLFGVASYYLYFLALRYINLVDATTLYATAPFFVPIIWLIWMKQKVERQVWWSIIVGFIGVAFILHPTLNILQPGLLFSILGGVSSAIALAAVRVLNLKRESMSRTLFYYFSFGTLISFPLAWMMWTPPTGIDWILGAGIGITTAIGQMLLTIAYRHGTASYLSPLGYSSVIYNALINYLIFRNELSWQSWVGMVLIITGGTLTFLWKSKTHPIKSGFETDQKRPPPS